MNRRTILAALLALAACGGDVDSRQQAQTYARDDLACQTDDDCCVVFDGCLAEGLIVSAADRAEVRALLDEASQEMCVACIKPAIQTRCAAGICTASIVEAGGGLCDYDVLLPLMKDHCGQLSLPVACAGGGAGGGASVPASRLRLNCSSH